MPRRSGAVARAIVIAGLSGGLIGAVGEAAEREGLLKGDPMMKSNDQSMPTKDGQKADGMKSDGMKREDPQPDGTTHRMGDKMKDDSMMTKEKR